VRSDTFHVPFARVSLSVLFVIAASSTPVVKAQVSSTACLDAARVLVDTDTNLRLAPESAAPYARQERTQNWTSTLGHEGTCLFDSSGRLFSVTITHFPTVGGEPGVGTDSSYSITCESEGNRRRECRLRSAPSVARLERQLSSAACLEGQTFGVQGTVLWVDRGCRGRFTVMPVWKAYTLSCESENYRRRECRTRGDSTARLVRKTSRSECVEGRSWGHFGSMLWVDAGCAGVFEISPSDRPGDGLTLERARDACRRRLQAEGFNVVEELGTYSSGRYIDITLRAGRDRVSTTMVCSFDAVTGMAQIQPR
jgi:hypothetical protein